MFSVPAKIQVVAKRLTMHKVLCFTALLLFVSALIFSVFYRLSDYESLKHWYLSLNSCFYQHETWDSRFFTPEVKAQGNLLTIVGILVSVAGIWYVKSAWNKMETHDNIKKPEESSMAMLWYAAVVIIALGPGIWEWSRLSPAYDEVFSSVNCAELPSFQIISYYMLPNNHLFFNLVNHVLFGWYGDPVKTGRLLSLVAYAGTVLCAFRWFNQFINHRLLAFVATIAVALQFTTLGFGVLARGYEWQLLCGWIAFISLINYTSTNNTASLRANTIINIFGFILIPSYLYFYLAEVMLMGAILCYERRPGLKYWKCQVIAILVVFLFYLPALSFSGIASFTENKYVRPVTADITTFIPLFASQLREYAAYCFSSLSKSGQADLLLFFLPMALLFSGQRKQKSVGLFYIFSWSATILCSLKMRHLPYERSLIAQYSITTACTIYTAHMLVSGVTRRFQSNITKTSVQLVFFVVPMLLLCGHLFVYSKYNASYHLFEYDINNTYKRNTDQMHLIPEGSTIAFSDQSFYLFYMYRKSNYHVSKCANGHEDYYIKLSGEDELHPIATNPDYSLFTKEISDYEVYKRK